MEVKKRTEFPSILSKKDSNKCNAELHELSSEPCPPVGLGPVFSDMTFALDCTMDYSSPLFFSYCLLGSHGDSAAPLQSKLCLWLGAAREQGTGSNGGQ